LEKNGGWTVRSTPTAFRRYADAVVKRLGDRVKNWMTWNEIYCFIGLGYELGELAPFRRENQKTVLQAYHHGLLAHGHGLESVREHGGRGARVGAVYNPKPWVPVMETPADIAAARDMFRQTNEAILDPIFHGRYPARKLKAWGKNRPSVERGDMALISRKMDFIGYNIYTADYAAAGRSGEPRHVPFSPQYPRADMPWLHIVPQTLYWTFRFSDEIYGPQRYYVTENGCAYAAGPDSDGKIDDVERIQLVRTYLTQLRRAIRDGVDIRGYFLWSFLDNYEWAAGYAKRFGIVHVNYKTQVRTPKLSAHWYSRVIQANAVL